MRHQTLGKKILIAVLAVLYSMSMAQSFEQIQSNIATHTLSNGMKWIVFERHDAPIVSFNLYADVGSANESYGITGISHLLEHMAFKGTEIVGTNNYDEEKLALSSLDSVYALLQTEKAKINPEKQRLEILQSAFDMFQAKAKTYVITNELVDLFDNEGEAGLNAGTGTDNTEYTNALPSNRLEFWMALTSDRFMNPVFREFYKERNVVIEERRLRTETQPIGRLMEDLFASAFKSHPYHHSVVGHMSDIQAITRQDVIDYFNKFYIPSNIVVGIAGDVKPKEVFAMAEKYFGRIPGSAKPLPPRTIEPEQWGQRRVKVEAQSQPILLFGYHRPAAKHSHDAALGALANILGQGRSSWLYTELVKKQKIAIDCGAFNGFPGNKYPNLIAFYAVPAQGHTAQECLDAIDIIIEKAKTEAVIPNELNKYKRNTKKGMINTMKSNAGIASALCNAEIKLGGWKKFFEEYEDVQKLTADDVMEMAHTYLNKKNRTIAEIVQAQ
ncbi:insulinase family protein [bacterium]|nr:insulinase family protein [bacterium]